MSYILGIKPATCF